MSTPPSRNEQSCPMGGEANTGDMENVLQDSVRTRPIVHIKKEKVYLRSARCWWLHENSGDLVESTQKDGERVIPHV